MRWLVATFVLGACGRIAFDPIDQPVPSAPMCTAAGWCWENPLPQGEPIRWLSGTSANDIWAACGNGQVMHYDGTSWSFGLAMDSRQSLSGIWAQAPDNVWAVTDYIGHGLTHFDGTSWTPSDLPQSHAGSGLMSGNAIYGIAPDDIWVVGFGGDAAHYDGSAWTQFTVTSSTDLYGVWFESNNDVFVSGDSGTMYRFNGTTWTRFQPTTNGVNQSAWGTAPNDVWTGGYSNKLWHFDGTSWLPSTVATTNFYSFTGGWSASHDDVWAATWEGGLFRGNFTTGFTDYGWGETLYGFWGASADDIWVGGDGGRLHHWNGVEWLPYFQFGPLTILNAIDGTSPSNLWVVGGGGTILRRDTTGHWKPFDSPSTTSNFNDVKAFAANDVWIAGYGVVFHWDGTTWTKAVDEPMTTFLHIDGTASNDLWAITDRLNVEQVRHYDGTSWNVVDTGATGYFGGIWVRGLGDVWLSRDANILHLEAGTWVQRYTQPYSNTTRFTGTSNDDVWAMGPQSINHWDGTSWTEYAAPLLRGREYLNGLSMLAPDDIWFVADFAMYHWDGLDVTKVSPRPTSNRLKDVIGFGSEMWSVGSSGTILHR
ncbi:MAG TPA: hypothetical protein VL326_22555 [Kofleriaceae bacterium]|nr:hypothetical protein [Kofleriaceae bacterium]